MASKTSRSTKLILLLIVVVVASTLYQSKLDDEQQQIKNQQVAKVIEQKSQAFKSNKQNILDTARKNLNNPDHVVKTLKEFIHVNDQDLTNLYNQARIASITNQLKKIPTEQYNKNLNLYTQLANLDPDPNKHKSKIDFYTSKVKEKQIADATAKARDNLIGKGFSAWDGSHRALEKHIKKRMNNPDSYEHIDTKYYDRGDFIIVTTRFRGANAFGGLVVNEMTAKAGLDGHLLEIID
jgi:hypothetical protein